MRDSAAPYKRPAVAIDEYRDADGCVIPYGHRWQDEPPEWAYSRPGHGQRFDPLFPVAQALCEYLERTYNVASVKRGSETIFSPPVPDQAPMTVNADPGKHCVSISAGLAFVSVIPDCGCQACDDDILDLIESLEEQVFAIVEGGLTESLKGRWLNYDLEMVDGGGWAGSSRIDRSRAKALKRTFPRHLQVWKPWE